MRFSLRLKVRPRGRCALWREFTDWFMLTAVLLLWIYVVYNKNRYILALMSVCYVAEVAGVVTILGISFKTYQGS